MSESINPLDRAAIEKIVASLEAAWNAADGPGFAAPFAPDADFVNIRAEHYQGRDAIGEAHTGIFQTIYAGSVNRYTLESARLIRPDVALVHVRALLKVPAGPLAGNLSARFSAVLTRESAGWQIASFHNTLVPPKPI
jgi:uncharacterized protein (TIGR02246 family)